MYTDLWLALAADVVGLRDAVAERVGQVVRVLAEQKAGLGQQVLSEPAARTRETFPLRRQPDAAVLDANRTGHELFGQTHVDEPVFLDVFVREHRFERVLADAAAALLQLFEQIERKRSIDE